MAAAAAAGAAGCDMGGPCSRPTIEESSDGAIDRATGEHARYRAINHLIGHAGRDAQRPKGLHSFARFYLREKNKEGVCVVRLNSGEIMSVQRRQYNFLHLLKASGNEECEHIILTKAKLYLTV